MTESITSRVLALLGSHSPDTVTVATTIESLGWDNLDREDFVDELVDEFDVDIPDEPAHEWITVQDIVNTVVQAVGGTEAV